MFLPSWQYDGGDPGLRLFTLANPLLPEVEKGCEVFEIGSCDTDFLDRVEQCRPDLKPSGVDWREFKSGNPRKVLRGNVLELTFGDGRFGAIFGLSSIEHIGLGRYQNDPINSAGDWLTIAKVRDWLKPGGWCYFDVPYTPEGSGVYSGNKCRCYDDQTLTERFGAHEVLGYTDLAVSGWIEKPTKNNEGLRPFYYVALLIRKD